MKLPYFAEGMSKYFNHSIYKFGAAKLVNKHGKYYLHIPVTYEVEESNISDICNVVGIDRGIILNGNMSADNEGRLQVKKEILKKLRRVLKSYIAYIEETSILEDIEDFLKNAK